ncbi:hypothetical protein EMEDMD4_110004 [Sinorhizobium medicae]|uniref:Uncharacterized protein n=1 Tax=Sinorhizobium medicae TaxID=110321 RepID=A0A508WPX5_9HYPH|nr:hypothetical protein EMEDMD4_110004 [Sinorhizobium medicae]
MQPVRIASQRCRGIAQLVERRSPKPQVGGSSPSAPAILFVAAVPDTGGLRGGGGKAVFVYSQKRLIGSCGFHNRSLCRGPNRHAVRGADKSALRAVMA